MKKMILKMLVVTLFFQAQTTSAYALSAEAQAIENFNSNLATTLNVENMSAEEIDQMIEANEYAGEEELTQEEINELQKSEIEANDDDVEDIGAINNITQLQADMVAKTRKVGGVWGVHFMYISKEGQKKLLTAQNMNRSLAPASTLKVFSGYLAFLNRSYNTTDLSVMLHVSSNPMADAALKSVTGNMAKSKALLKKTYAGLEDLNKLVMIDGSGLSRSNRVTARLETSLLEKIYKDGKYDSFKRLLAQPGEWSTMRLQLTDIDQNTCESSGCTLGRDINIYAKTGTLPRGRVKGLTGFVESSKGVMIFSMVANGVNVGPAKIAMQQIVRNHTKYLKAQGSL